MWIDDLLNRNEKELAQTGTVSIGGEVPAVETDCEHRELKILRPAGILRLPRLAERQLVMDCGDEFVTLGPVEGETPEGLLPGEMYIQTENAAVVLKNSGAIEITGEVRITGSLTVNGREVDGA